MAEEHLVVGTVGMMMTEEVRTTVKAGMPDTMINHGAPEMITLGTIVGVMIEVPLPQRPKLNLKPQSTPKENDSSSTFHSSRGASIFGGQSVLTQLLENKK